MGRLILAAAGVLLSSSLAWAAPILQTVSPGVLSTPTQTPSSASAPCPKVTSAPKFYCHGFPCPKNTPATLITAPPATTVAPMAEKDIIHYDTIFPTTSYATSILQLDGNIITVTLAGTPFPTSPTPPPPEPTNAKSDYDGVKKQYEDLLAKDSVLQDHVWDEEKVADGVGKKVRELEVFLKGSKMSGKDQTHVELLLRDLENVVMSKKPQPLDMVHGKGSDVPGHREIKREEVEVSAPVAKRYLDSARDAGDGYRIPLGIETSEELEAFLHDVDGMRDSTAEEIAETQAKINELRHQQHVVHKQAALLSHRLEKIRTTIAQLECDSDSGIFHSQVKCNLEGDRLDKDYKQTRTELIRLRLEEPELNMRLSAAVIHLDRERHDLVKLDQFIPGVKDAIEKAKTKVATTTAAIYAATSTTPAPMYAQPAASTPNNSTTPSYGRISKRQDIYSIIPPAWVLPQMISDNVATPKEVENLLATMKQREALANQSAIPDRAAYELLRNNLGSAIISHALSAKKSIALGERLDVLQGTCREPVDSGSGPGWHCQTALREVKAEYDEACREVEVLSERMQGVSKRMLELRESLMREEWDVGELDLFIEGVGEKIREVKAKEGHAQPSATTTTATTATALGHARPTSTADAWTVANQHAKPASSAGILTVATGHAKPTTSAETWTVAIGHGTPVTSSTAPSAKTTED